MASMNYELKSNMGRHFCHICQIGYNDSPLHVVVSTLAQAKSTDLAQDNCLYKCLMDPKDEYRSIIQTIRQETDTEKIRNLKKQLPAFFPSGLYLRRGILKEYSGLICIDIDFKDNVEYIGFDQLKTDLFPKFDSIAYGGSSVSGKGYFVLFVNADQDKHLEVFREIQCAFKQHGIKIDTSKKNTTDLRFYSFDLDPYINEYATTFKSIYCPLNTHRSMDPRAKPKLTQTGPDSLIQFLDKVLAEGRPLYFEYDAWWKLASGLYNELGESGRYYFHEFSSMEPEKYDPINTDKMYNNAKKYTDIKAGSVVHIIKDAGGT
jgi:hypothetical protein